MSRTSHRGNSQPRWLFPFVIIVVFLLSVLPLGRLAATGIASAFKGGAAGLLTDPALWDSVYYTLTTSFFGMLVSVLLGGGFALLLTLFDLRAKTLLGFLFMLPTMIPPQVTALSWIGMTGPSSALLRPSALRRRSARRSRFIRSAVSRFSMGCSMRRSSICRCVPGCWPCRVMRWRRRGFPAPRPGRC